MKTSRPVVRTRPRPRRRRVVEGVLLGIGFVVLLDAFFGERGLVEMIRGLEHYDRLEKDVTSIKQQNDQLREQIDGLTNDPDVIEDRARREQHLIKPGERVFIIRDQPEGSEPER